MLSAPRASRVRARSLIVAAVLVVISAAACDPLPIPGAGPLRYRDPIFTSVTTTADVTYGSAPDRAGNTVTLKLDIYRPSGDTATDRPVIVFVHGGSFSGGNKSSPEILDETNVLTMKGYVTASIDYRLSKQGCPPANGECVRAILDAREDAQAAVRFFRKHAATYGINPARIGIAGTSAGAITAIDVAWTPEVPGNSGNPGYSSAVSGAVSLSGSAITGTPDRGDPPVLDFHGTNDPLVPYAWAKSTVDSARAAGVVADLVTWQGDGHVPYVKHRQQILDLTTNFFFRAFHLPIPG